MHNLTLLPLFLVLPADFLQGLTLVLTASHSGSWNFLSGIVIVIVFVLGSQSLTCLDFLSYLHPGDIDQHGVKPDSRSQYCVFMFLCT